ncbi:MAG: methylase involved in ubiquinone/menaquinone biosynthesis [Solidesulfovibrio magneticus str. Maddingley MBC34]|uniref:Methylase involved in ubiquinone/menaquinone biosynthesis n=1 Tax=Solidesulfovibrio magneticus str. Maddingley MBC34 TaxID=1206767 RepID=K6FHM8_9BACT|nr:MAG: methylase involved in ubiquinone/menaquinone biosynthesis [Solidesulfovibrio magneticus str. Maddingley MBC34]
MYWETAASVPSSLELAPEVRSLIGPGDRLVDLGCGPGRTLAGLRRDGLGACHVGADCNPPSLALAAGLGLVVVRADLAALPFADGAFDVAVLQAVMTTLPTPAARLAVLAEARRVAGSLLCLSDFLRNPDLPYYRARYEAGLAETGEEGSFVVREGEAVLYQAHHFTFEELVDLLSQAGFGVVQAVFPRVKTRSGNIVAGVSLAAKAL